MSVISNVTVTPNRIEALLRLINHDGGSTPTETLRGRFLIPALQTRGETDSTTPLVFNEARALGLITLANQVAQITLKDIARASVLEALERSLLWPEAAAEAGHRDFPFALAWMLTFDPLQPIPADISIAVSAETGQFLDMTSASRGEQMLHWTRYLGFTRELAVGNVRHFLPDPSAALRRQLDAIFGGAVQLEANVFMRRWADVCPVIDGGEARRQVEEWMRATNHANRMPPDDTISASASQALNHLDRSGEIELVSTGADHLKLSLALPGIMSAVSHIRRGRAA